MDIHLGFVTNERILFDRWHFTGKILAAVLLGKKDVTAIATKGIAKLFSETNTTNHIVYRSYMYSATGPIPPPVQMNRKIWINWQNSPV